MDVRRVFMRSKGGYESVCDLDVYLKSWNSDVYRWFACLDQCPWNDSLADDDDDDSNGSPGVGVVDGMNTMWC